MEEVKKFEIVLVIAFIYNFLYGVLYWELAGVPGIIIGLNFLMAGAIIGITLRRRNE